MNLSKDIVHERAWVKTSAFAVGVRILAETRNRRHSRELFKILRDNYEEVQVLGFYDSPEDYVAGNLQSEAFEHVEEEEPFEGDMNKQYNSDIVEEEDTFSEEDVSMSPDEIPVMNHKDKSNNISVASSSEKMARRNSRNF